MSIYIFEIFLYTVLLNTNNFLIDLFFSLMELWQVLQFWVRVELEVIAMKEYSTLPNSSEKEPYHQM